MAGPILVFVPFVIIGLTNPASLKELSILFGLLLLLFLELAVWLLILLCRTGDAGPNRYGDPAPITPA